MSDSDAFLGATGASSDLLPSNTQLFVSTPRMRKPFYIVLTVGAILAAILVAVGSSSALSGSAKGAVLGAAAAVGLVALCGAGFLRRLYIRLYNEALKQGAWHEGLVVFPSGDVVVRFGGVFVNTDKTIESAFLSRAQVERRCSFLHFRARNFLKLYYLTLDARPAVISICEDDLRDGVARVADYINDLKAKTSHAASAFGGSLAWTGGVL